MRTEWRKNCKLYRDIMALTWKIDELPLREEMEFWVVLPP